MEPTTKEEIDVVLANNKLIGEFMDIKPEIEYSVGDDEGYIYNPRNVGNYFSWPHQQEAECNRWLSEHPELVKQGYKTKMNEWWPWYNQDWNKLMDVWYKFLGVRFAGHNNQFKHAEIKTTVGYAIIYGDINLAYQRLVEAINWYNSTKQ